MDSRDLGMDRTVSASWAPDDTWPVAEDEIDEAAEVAASPDLPAGTVATEVSGSVTVEPTPAALAGARNPEWHGGSVMFDSSAVTDGRPDAVRSVAAIEGHPIHPMIVPLPIGSFVGAFLCDLAYVRTGDGFFARGARVLTGAGVVTGLMAGMLGAADFTGREEVRSRRAAWVHAGGNLAVLALGVASEAMRMRDERRAVRNGALVISAASAAILGLTGWLGGELSYRDRIGVVPR